jgi:phosphatidate phosphatase LPIN
MLRFVPPRFSAPSHLGNNLGSGTPPPYGPSSSSPTINTVGLPFPTMRATSEPPPDTEEEKKPSSIPTHTRHLSRPLNIPTLSGDEYLWEWGGFPQKSPLRTTFGPPGISEALGSGWDEGKAVIPLRNSNSPPEDSTGVDIDEEEGGYGTGGRLRPDRNEPYRFILLIERKTTYFELGLFAKDEPRRKFGRNGVEDEQIFNERRIDYKTFLDDDSVFQKGDVVIRWAGDRWVWPTVR